MEISVAEAISLACCFMASGFFSGSEAVLMSIDIDRARQLISDGGPKGKALNFMVEKSNEVLATILVGNNVVNILASALTTAIASRMFKDDAVGISVGVTTFIVLIFGEIIPKTFARNHAEKLCVFVIRVLQLCYYTLYPFIRTIVYIIEAVLGENAEIQGRVVRKRDIEYMVNKAEKEQSMDSKQLDMLTSILEFPRIKVKDIMIPRSKVKHIQINEPFGEILLTLRQDVHSRYPVIDGELENVKGFLHVKDLAFLTDEEKKSFNIEKYLKQPFFVYEHMKIQSVFDHMNRKKVHLALVKDENGIVVGIITLEDIVEEILGDIQDEHDLVDHEVTREYQVSDDKNGLLLEAGISLRDLYNNYDIKIPLNDNFSTLAGFILDMLGNNFPEQGQIIVFEGWTFEVHQVDNNEIKSIKIKDVDGEKHVFAPKSNGRSTESEEKPLTHQLDLVDHKVSSS